jgi:hypothetical protein
MKYLCGGGENLCFSYSVPDILRTLEGKKITASKIIYRGVKESAEIVKSPESSRDKGGSHR